MTRSCRTETENNSRVYITSTQERKVHLLTARGDTAKRLVLQTANIYEKDPLTNERREEKEAEKEIAARE